MKSASQSMRQLLNGVKQLAKNGFFHIFGSSVINQIVRFAYGLLIVRIIPKANYGVYGYATTIYYTFLLISGFSLDSAILQLTSEYADDKERSNSLVQYTYRLGLCINTGISLLILLVALFVPLKISGSNALLGFMFLLPLPDIIRRIQIQWLRAELKNKEYALINTIDVVVLSFSVIVLSIFFMEKGAILGQYVTAIIIILLLVFWLKVPTFKPYRPLDRALKKDLFKIGGISTLNNALGGLLSLVGTIILGIFVSDESVIASYKVALTIPTALQFIPLALATYIYPHFARNHNNYPWVRSNFRIVLFGCLAVNVIIAIGGILFAPLIIRLLYGAAYLDCVVPFRILMISYFIAATFRIPAGNLLVTQRRLVFNLVVDITGALTNIAANVLLIPRFFSVGAALSELITMLVTGILFTGYFAWIIRRKNNAYSK